MSTRFTVVIPTRERSDTLEWALKTCVTQDYDNLEIIVSDNCSMDRTEEVVRSFNDPRITYLNTGKRLSMTDNWEFALANVRGGHVTYIGDDDGLLPNALVHLDTVIREHQCQAIIWPRQFYYWPGFAHPAYANTLILNLFQNETVREVHATQMLRDAIEFRRNLWDLPSIYYGFIHYDVIQAIMERSGAFFHSITPDIYSSVAIASVLETYHISSRAYALAGLSRHSNGASFMFAKPGSDPASPAQRYLSENTLSFHPELVMAPSFAFLLAESYLQARDHLGYPEKLPVDMRKVFSAALEEKNLLTDPALYRAVVRAVEEVAVKHGIEEYARVLIAGHRYRSVSALARSALGYIFSRDALFRSERLGITNIHQAAYAFDLLLRKYQSPVVKCVVYFANYFSKAVRLTKLTLGPLVARLRDVARCRIAFRTKP